MANPISIDRREFTVATVLALLSGATILVEEGCGGGSSPSSASGGTVSDVVGQISDNHGHVAIITGAQITADNTVNLDIRGTATHTHSVPVSASDILSIAGGGTVTALSSTTEAHDHTVTFLGAAPGGGGRY